MVISVQDIENLLDVYTFEDILDLNDLTEADVLLFLVDQGFVNLPKIKPLNFSDD